MMQDNEMSVDAMEVYPADEERRILASLELEPFDVELKPEIEAQELSKAQKRVLNHIL